MATNDKNGNDKKGIDKIYTEKERYNFLRKAGYSVSEAKKMRRYGIGKFLEATKKKEKVYIQAREKYYDSPVELKNTKVEKFKIEKARYNYVKKYNYIVKAYYNEKGNAKPVVRYFTYSTGKKINELALQQEINEYCMTAGIKYELQLISFEVVALEIK